MAPRCDCPDNIILIGMPGAGKSTVGVLLAKRLGYNFADSDLLLQAQQRRRLQAIIAEQGLATFKRLEEELLCSLQGHRTVFATGGSAVYSETAMQHMQSLGRRVFLDVPLAELSDRIRDMDSRGLVIDPGQDLADLYRQRLPLYRRHADLTIHADQLTAEAAAAAIEAAVCATRPPGPGGE